MGLNLLRRHRVETAGPTVADVVDRDPADLQAELERQYDELADMVARLSGGERIVALGRFAEDTRQAVMARLATIDAEASRTPEALLGRVEAALSQAADDAAAAALAGDTQSVEAIRALQGRLAISLKVNTDMLTGELTITHP